MSKSLNNDGFSLVELSIVLVILGLLTGGVLTGQSLIRAAELRGVITEFQTYQTAVHSFQSQYFQLPGDINNATEFWGSAGGDGTIGDGCEAATGTGTQTCNGDGNGYIKNEGNGGEYAQRFTFWQHLSSAGLIPGTYTGMNGNDRDHHIDENCPKSRLGSAYWAVYSDGDQINTTGSPDVFDGDYTGEFLIGDLATNSGPREPILSPEELWSVDNKIDDGRPATGKIVPRDRIDCALAADGTALTTSATDAAKFDSIYNLTDTSKSCAPIFRQTFR